jgi:hypothetical protein
MSAAQRLRVGLGAYIVGAGGCSACHSSPAGFLAGGNPFKADLAGHTVFSRNLTPDPATGLNVSLDEFKRILRTGFDRRDAQTMLLVMPWLYFRWMSDDDLEAIYAYLQVVPPVSNVTPPDEKAGAAAPPSIPFPGLYDDGDVIRNLPASQGSFNPARGVAIAPRPNPVGLEGDALMDYGIGSYIANAMTHCSNCHTNPARNEDNHIDTPAYFAGGVVSAVPPPLEPVTRVVRSTAANLKGTVHGFFNEPADTLARFRLIITTGTHADETPPVPLGWPMSFVATNLANLLEEDLESVYRYAKGVPSVSGAPDVLRQSYARYCASAADCHARESCAVATSECVGRTCAADIDCDTCQTCVAGACQAPDPSSACLAAAQ